jgi:hypothetical protein
MQAAGLHESSLLASLATAVCSILSSASRIAIWQLPNIF